MKGFIGDIEDLTEENTDFRRVLYTGRQIQLVLMSLEPGEEIGEEVHDDRDQFFRVEEGEGEVWIDGNRTAIEDDIAIVARGSPPQHRQHRRRAAPPLHALCAAGASRRHRAPDEGRRGCVGRALRRANDRVTLAESRPGRGPASGARVGE